MPSLQILQITLQAVSSFAIAGGLLYTAFQFREARKAQGVANFAKLVELQYQLRKIRVDNPSLASVHEEDVKDLHSDRDIQAYFLSLMQLSLFEIAWYAHKEGQLPDDYFESWEKRMQELGDERAFRNMLANPAMKIMHDDFDKYVRQLLRKPSTRSSLPTGRGRGDTMTTSNEASLHPGTDSANRHVIGERDREGR